MIVALDPGVTTGVAVFTPTTIIVNEWRYDTAPHARTYHALNILKPKLVISEAFHFRQDKTGAVFTGVEYIGVIKCFCQQNGVEHIEMTPGQGKGFWDNRKIKALGWWKPSAPHAMDAIRILFTHLMNTDEQWKSAALTQLKEKL